jgi:hypothetical protein
MTDAKNALYNVLNEWLQPAGEPISPLYGAKMPAHLAPSARAQAALPSRNALVTGGRVGGGWNVA